MKKIFIASFCFACMSFPTFGQGGIDYNEVALNLSRNDFGGTARSMSMAGAFGALGADVSTLSTNPAGLGVYRTGEYSFSTSLTAAGTQSTFQGNKNSSDRFHLNVNGFGLIGVMKTNASSGIKSVNFGFGMNRLADYNRNYSVSAKGTPFSQVDAYANDANGTPYTELVSNGSDEFSHFNNVSNWQSINAWESGLIGRAPSSDGGFIPRTYTTVLGSDELVDQTTLINERGTLDEYDFSMGLNINDKLYFGATIGLQDLYYSNSSHHFEDFDLGGGYDDWRDLILRGSGVNFKLGAIYTPTSSWRFGLAFHTPTYLKITEDYYSEMQSFGLEGAQYFDGSDYYYAYGDGTYDASHKIYSDSYPNQSARYDYNLNTPMKGMLSAAYILDRKMIFSFDYEYSDYRRMKLSDNSGGLGGYNSLNDQLYNSSHTFRFGTEYRMAPNWMVRAGYAYYGSPYDKDFAKANGFGYEDQNQYVTTGIGYRYKYLFVDFAYVIGLRNISNYQLYNVDDARVDYRLNQQRFALTLGVRL